MNLTVAVMKKTNVKMANPLSIATNMLVDMAIVKTLFRLCLNDFRVPASHFSALVDVG